MEVDRWTTNECDAAVLVFIKHFKDSSIGVKVALSVQLVLQWLHTLQTNWRCMQSFCLVSCLADLHATMLSGCYNPKVPCRCTTPRALLLQQSCNRACRCTTPQSAHSYTYFGFGIGWWRHPENLGVPVSYHTRPKLQMPVRVQSRRRYCVTWATCRISKAPRLKWLLELLGWIASGCPGTIRAHNLSAI
jgi:hypothetical protein